MSSKRRVLLIFPPAFYPHMPYLSLPTISSVLNKNDIANSILDLNILLYRSLLNENSVTLHLRSLRSRLNKRNVPLKLLSKSQLTAHPAMDDLSELLPQALLAIKGKRNSLNNNLNPWKILSLGLDIASDAHFPEELTFSGYYAGFSSNSSNDVLQAARNHEKSLYYNQSITKIYPELNSGNVDIVAFSITSLDQLIPAAGLSFAIRKEYPNLKIMWGGNIPSRLDKFFSFPNKLSELYDVLVIGEGDSIILDGIDYLRNNTSTVKEKPLVLYANLNDPINLQRPNFDDLSLSNYLGRYIILPYQISRKCYWGKCMFCDIHKTYSGNYKIRSIEQIVDDLEYLTTQHNTQHIKFTDDASSPSTLMKISREIIRRGLDLSWEAYVRLDKAFLNPNYCSLLKNAGCKWLYFGLESGSQKSLQKMNKFNNINENSEILRSVAKAGIGVHVWVIIGFPSEKRDDIKYTTDFIFNNSNYIHSIEINQFALTRLSPIWHEKYLSKFGIKPIINPLEDLALTFDYDVESGITQHEAEVITKETRKLVEDELNIPNFVRSSNLDIDISREHNRPLKGLFKEERINDA